VYEMKLHKKSVNYVDVQDWDDLVEKTYGRPYCFQQQDGCKERGTFEFSVPSRDCYDFGCDTVPEKVNHEDMGVSFKAWLERDPEQLLDTADEWERKNGLHLWWTRNFYPSVDMIIDDLHEKGLLDEGEYVINIDW